MIGIIVTNLTITNIQMKEAERQTKHVFYEAEEVMDDLAAGLNRAASDCLQKAYTEMLSNFRELTSDGENVQNVFSKMYLDNLVDYFNTTDSTVGTTYEKHVKSETIDEESVVQYQIGYYSISKLRSALTMYALDTENDVKKNMYVGHESDFLSDEYYLATDDEAFKDTAKYFFHADYENKIFVLEKVGIEKTDNFNNNTTIQTDIVFHVPEVNFNGSNIVKDFMRYSLIADKSIMVNNTGITVDGCVYAGSKGIFTSGNSSASFLGSKIVTRGDIKATTLGSLVIGNIADTSKTQVWCENLITEKVGAVEQTTANSAKMTVAGNIFVSDDLEMNGDCDEVTLLGNYFGYNFQKNYGDNEPLSSKTNADYSSAIVINGRNSNLNIMGLNRLMVAGRTFIGRQTGTGTNNMQDIPLAEVLGVKTNQLAYYVPSTYVNKAKNQIRADKVDDFKSYCGVSTVMSYLPSGEAAQQVIPFNYLYKKNATEYDTDTVYYLNFKSEQDENTYFMEYYKKHRATLNLNADNYLVAGAAKIKEGLVMDLKGNLLVRDSTDNINELYTTIQDEKWKKGGSNFGYSADRAVQYHSLQMTLEDHSEGISVSDVRVKKVLNNKAYDITVDEDQKENLKTTLFRNLIDTNDDAEHPGELEKFFQKVETKTYVREFASTVEDSDDVKILAIIDNDGATDAAYPVSTATYSGGLIIATGDVVISSSATKPFAGTIICGGQIRFDSATSAYVTSDEVLISQMISQDIMLREPVFATIFKAFKNSSGSSVNSDRIADYLTYENWTKTME
jgi:hypothetical protein